MCCIVYVRLLLFLRYFYPDTQTLHIKTTVIKKEDDGMWL